MSSVEIFIRLETETSFRSSTS